MRRTILTLALLSAVAWGQRYSFASFGQNSGLGNLNVNGIVADGAGFVWAGTENGLFRLEGDHFRRFGRANGLGNEFIYSLHADRGGQLWVGTDDGLYLRQGDRFVNVALGGARVQVKPDSAFADEAGGKLLVVTGAGLIEIAAAAKGAAPSAALYFSRHPTSSAVAGQTIRSVLRARDGALWLGCGVALCRLAQGQWTSWGPAQGVPPGAWMELFQAGDGALWARDADHVIDLPAGGARFDSRDAGLPAARSNDGYYTIAEDPMGRVVTAMAQGVVRWEGGRWRLIGSAQGLDPYPITTLAFLPGRQGAQAQAWFGFAGHGLMQWLGYGAWESWTPQEGLANSTVWAVLQTAPDTTWVATEQGVDIVNPLSGAVRPFPRLGPDGREAIRFLQQSSDGQVWFFNRNGAIFAFDPRTQGLVRYPRLPGSYFDALADDQNRVWLATSSGLYRADAAARRRFLPVRGSGFDTHYFYDIAESHGGEFWASGRTGLFHLVAGDWRKIALPAKGLDPRFELIAPAEDGSVWVSDYVRAIDRLYISGDRVSKVEPVNPPTVASEQVVSMGTDRRGWVWVGTDHGADVFNGEQWRRVTEDNGLLWNDLNNHAFSAAPDGGIWLGTSAGVSHLRRPQTVFAPLSLRAAITSIQYGGGQPLVASFTALGETGPASLEYRYRLAGFERDWTSTTTGEVRYTNLPPGDFRLEVSAEETAQHVRSPVASAPVEIDAPWWRSWWLEFVLGLGVAGLILGMLRWRERRLRARQQALERLVAARTAELESEKAELLAAREELHIQATRDGLTQLWNRNAIFSLLATELERAAREDSRLAVVLVDLDHFKSINDRFGHLRGDVVLQEAARRFLSSARAYDSVGRYGGEEFLILMPGLDRADGVARLEVMRQAITGEPFLLEGAEIRLTCSLGVIWVRGDAELEAVIETADRALYQAKELGRNRIEYANAWR